MRNRKFKDKTNELNEEVLREIEDDFEARTEGLEESPVLYTIEDASGILGISEREIIRFIHLKRLPSIRVGKFIRLKKEDIDEFFERIGSEKNILGAPILYTAEQVSKILQLTVDNIWKLLKSGQLKGFQLRDGIRSPWRIRKEDLGDYIVKRINKKQKELITKNESFEK